MALESLIVQKPYNGAVGPSVTHGPSDEWSEWWVAMKNAPEGASLLGAWRGKTYLITNLLIFR